MAFTTLVRAVLGFFNGQASKALADNATPELFSDILGAMWTHDVAAGTSGTPAPSSAILIGSVDGSGNLQPASAATPVPMSASALPLPTGAATAALQTALNALLAAGLPAALGTGGGLKIDGSGTPLSVTDATSSAAQATCGNTSTSAAQPLLQEWATSQTWAVGQVRRTAAGNVAVCTTAGAGATSGVGPALGLGGADNVAAWNVYAGTSWGGILVANADASILQYVGLGSQITAGGDLSGGLVPAQSAVNWPRGVDVTKLYIVAASGTPAYTVTLTQ